MSSGGRDAGPVDRELSSTPQVVWFLYMVRCRDGTLHTGITTDVARRMAEHAAPGRRGARYVRGRGPLEFVWSLAVDSRGAARAWSTGSSGSPAARRKDSYGSRPV